jgi:ABC-type multidrug transport system permease subunit
MLAQGYRGDAVIGLQDAFDYNIYVGDSLVKPWVMYLVLTLCTAAFILIYVLLNRKRTKQK